MKQLLVKFTVALAAVLAPAQSMILTCLGLIILDFVTGLMAAKKKQVAITSAGLRRTVSKLVIYETAIILAYLVQKYMFQDTLQIAAIASGFIGMTELLSVYENLNVLSGSNLLKELMNRIGSANQQRPPES